MELTNEQIELKEAIEKAEIAAQNARGTASALRYKCEKAGHVVKVKTKPSYVGGKGEYKWEDWGSAQCEVCGVGLGWYCTESPKHYCEYDPTDENAGDDCIHCGEPEERK